MNAGVRHFLAQMARLGREFRHQVARCRTALPRIACVKRCCCLAILRVDDHCESVMITVSDECKGWRHRLRESPFTPVAHLGECRVSRDHLTNGAIARQVADLIGHHHRSDAPAQIAGRSLDEQPVRGKPACSREALLDVLPLIHRQRLGLPARVGNPRRVADDDVESAGVHDGWKLAGPVDAVVRRFRAEKTVA